MSRPVRIRSSLPSIEETALRAGVSPARRRELIRLAQQLQLSDTSTKTSGSATKPASKNGIAKHGVVASSTKKRTPKK